MALREFSHSLGPFQTLGWRWRAFFETIRDEIFGRYPPISELVSQTFPEDPRGPDAFKYALELYLRMIPDLGVSIDGLTFLRVVDETAITLRAVGISYLLPEGQLFIETRFRSIDGAIEYEILVGAGDSAWDILSESRRWKAVYAYATEGIEPSWDWAPPVIGTLDK